MFSGVEIFGGHFITVTGEKHYLPILTGEDDSRLVCRKCTAAEPTARWVHAKEWPDE